MSGHWERWIDAGATCLFILYGSATNGPFGLPHWVWFVAAAFFFGCLCEETQ